MSGRAPKITVSLSLEERKSCHKILLSEPCKTVRIRISVLLDVDNYKSGELTYAQIAAEHCTNKDFPARVVAMYKEHGLEGLKKINRNTASDSANSKMDSRIEAYLVAMACTPPPAPYARWTVSLCTIELNRRKSVNFGKTTVWRAMKRNKLRPHRSEYWCIPSITDAFVLCMERVLYLYSLPYDRDNPVVCMDEAALQILSDVKQRLEMNGENTEKIDYEYRRLGTKNLFVFIEPKTGRYYVRATDSRTAVDWAQEIKILAFHLYPDAKKITVISDNLNVHTLESLYKAFPPEEARQIAERIIFVHTPVHASWLNMAEIAINVVKKECIGKRFRTEKEAAELPARLKVWEENKNAEPKPFAWNFTVEKARERPHLYKLECSPEWSSAKYAEENALCVMVPSGQVKVSSHVASDGDEAGDIIDLCRSVDEHGKECWSISREEKMVVLHEPVGNEEIAALLRLRRTQDGWPVPSARIRQSRKKTDKDKKVTEVDYDYNFMAMGEDVVAVYNAPYDEKFPVVCIRKRSFDIENPSANEWVGTLRNESRPGKKKKNAGDSQADGDTEDKSAGRKEDDRRLGITFVYNPYTGEKRFWINDWSDDLSWGETFRDLVDSMYPEAERIRVIVCGEDLEKIATLESVCTVDEALRIDLKIELHAVPANGRWLNFAESEAISVCRRCLKDGVSSIRQVTEHLFAWQKTLTFVDFRLTLGGFRKTFSSVYR